MLDTDTKRRIDTARDILVGKVPDPKSQVEQITIALIYKFMDDMDAEAEELGGKRKFFAGEHARFGWAKLMAPSIGGHEMLSLYGEGISKHGEIIDLGVKAGIIEKAGSWYSYNSERIGQGKENARTYLKQNPAIADAIETQIRANASQLAKALEGTPNEEMDVAENAA